MYYLISYTIFFLLFFLHVIPSFQGLTNLIILDLYGNPLLERLENYRIYVVFHLPSLKALDGVAVVCLIKPVKKCSSGKIHLIICFVFYFLLFSQGSDRVWKCKGHVWRAPNHWHGSRKVGPLKLHRHHLPHLAVLLHKVTTSIWNLKH